MFGGIYGKVEGFFISFFIVLLVLPAVSVMCFLFGKKFFKNYIQTNITKKVRTFDAI